MRPSVRTTSVTTLERQRFASVRRAAVRAAILAACTAFVFLANPSPAQNTRPMVTWHWHLHQPIYWNDRSRISPVDRYENAWETIQMKRANFANPPGNNVELIFSVADRVAVYQGRTRDALGNIGGAHPNSGASVTYSGALMTNVASLAAAGQIGYGGTGWRDSLIEGMGWTTSTGAPRLDLVNFSFHHGLLPLLDPEIVDMEIKAFREKVRVEFGPQYLSKGFFPTEMAFSVRLIPVLEANGIEWSIVSGHHIARACPNYPYVKGTGGDICDPPNPADWRNPAAAEFIARPAPDSRGTPRHANPMSYQPSYVRYIDPETGMEHKVIAVPADQVLGYADGYGIIDASFLADLEARNDPAQPSLVLLAHDGDNAFGGGYSYYFEGVPNVANSAAAMGSEATSIQHYLNRFPPDPERIIHVEDGGWINPDNDFGSPTFNQWNYPLITQAGFDPINGWHYKPREMAVFHAALNRILTAEATSGQTRRINKVVFPDSSTTAIERGWHYLLGALDSGNVYFGAPLDMENLGAIGCNEVARLVDPLLAGVANTSADTVPPTIWIPQRYPYNPGSLNFGPAYNYVDTYNNGDFAIWTFVYDVSDVASVTLKYRIDEDGRIGLQDTTNHLYAGGEGVGEWTNIPMNGRPFPKDEPFDFGEIDYYELPLHIGDHYSAMVTGLREVLIDYYVEAVDSRGNVARSPIQHVWIGDGSGSSGCGAAVTLDPNPPLRGQDVTITYDPAGSNLASASQVSIHYGINNWTRVYSPDPAMTDNGDGTWSFTFEVDPCATSIEMVFNNGSGTWDNNSGLDWRFSAGGPPAVPCDPGVVTVATIPSPPVRESDVTIRYDATGRSLQGAEQVRIHYGYNNWSPIVTDPSNAQIMSPAGTNVWEFTFTVPSTATQIDCVFNNGSGTWDNNGGADWHFETIESGGIEPPDDVLEDGWAVR